MSQPWWVGAQCSTNLIQIKRSDRRYRYEFGDKTDSERLPSHAFRKTLLTSKYFSIGVRATHEDILVSSFDVLNVSLKKGDRRFGRTKKIKKAFPRIRTAGE